MDRSATNFDPLDVKRFSRHRFDASKNHLEEGNREREHQQFVREKTLLTIVTTPTSLHPCVSMLVLHCQ
jgi:hypothetical protein